MSARRVTVFLLTASFLSGFWCFGTVPRALAADGNDKPADLGAVENREPLPPNALYLLPLTSVKPRGWLRRQLRIQADGLSGHLDEFWPDLGPNSGWLGGTGEDWERGPYFLDGLVPLAYLLEDQKLIAKANKWVNWTLENQRPDGSIGPAKNQEWWPRMTMLKVLAQYQEATGDPRVIPLMTRYLDYHAKHAAERPLREWAKFRWGEEVLDILWLYNRTGDRRHFDLARTLHSQGHNWKAQFENFKYPNKTNKQMLGLKPDMSNTTEESLMAHGVNNGMALKYTTLWSLITGDASDRKAVYRQLEVLDKYHLLPNGLHSGDEHYAGPNPSQGVETCTVVETTFSLAHLVAVLGDPALGDRMEKIAFNSLPGAFTGDMWAHQYDQQPNQVLCTVRPRGWTSNGPESNVFGLEPYFGCCTANMHQGWPKFTANLWMATPDEGLAAVAYAPSEVNTVVGRGRVRVRVAEETEYPFRGGVTFLVDPASPVEFPFQLRIPEWARGATITVNGKTVDGVRPGTFHTLARRWQKGDRVELTLPLQVRTSQWFNDSVAVERGPLVFSLKIGEDWREIKSGMNRPAIPPAKDWEVHPTTDWNYGLIIDPADPNASAQVIEKAIGDFPFTSAGAPVEIKIKGRRVPQWTMEEGSAGPPPVSPAKGDGPVETLTLIPYGSAKLRITAFPRVTK